MIPILICDEKKKKKNFNHCTFLPFFWRENRQKIDFLNLYSWLNSIKLDICKENISCKIVTFLTLMYYLT